MRDNLVTEYRPDIDGLRAVAVLSVIGYHASPRLVQGGFVGVDIFFVISGYLISSIIFSALAKGRFSFIEFYSRRIRRIFPALIVVLLFSWGFGWFVLFTDEYKLLGKHMAGSAVFISNFLLWQESGYFDAIAGTKPLLHLWSLAVEEQYYLMWPLLLVLAWRRGWDLVSVIIFLLFLSFTFNVLSVRLDPALAFYWPHTRLWELLAGGLLAYSCTDRYRANAMHSRYLQFVTPFSQKYGAILNSGLAVLGGIFIGLSVFKIENELSFPGWWALFSVSGAFLIILTGRRAGLVQSLMSNRVLVLIGLISYPLYLWHWPLLWFANTIEVGYASVALRLFAIAISFILAWLTYRYIEIPVRKKLTTGANSTIPITLSILLVAAGGLGYWTYSAANFGRNGESQLIKDLSAGDYQAVRDTFVKCAPEFLGGQKFGMCLKSRQSAPEMAVIGDSHADHVFMGIAKLDERNTWILLGEGSCPPALDVRSYRTGRKDKCAEANRQIVDFLVADGAIKTVVLASLGPYYFSGMGFAPEHLVPGEFDATQWNLEQVGQIDRNVSRKEVYFDGLDKTIDVLERAQKEVVLYVDVPELNFSPRECVKRPLHSIGRERCAISRNAVETRQKEYRSVVAGLQLKHPNLRVFDPINYLCNAEECAASSGDAFYYRDGHHLSVRGSELLAKAFLAWRGVRP